jgi:hypothetical protein
MSLAGHQRALNRRFMLLSLARQAACSCQGTVMNFEMLPFDSKGAREEQSRKGNKGFAGDFEGSKACVFLIVPQPLPRYHTSSLISLITWEENSLL